MSVRHAARIAAVLFDWDGTLVDSLPVVMQATNRVLVADGFAALTADAVHDGMRLPTVPRMALHAGLADDATGRATAERMADEFYRIAAEIGHDHLLLFPGIRALLDRLATDGVPMAIVSNNRRSVVDPLIDQLGLRSHFALVLGEEDVAVPKPAPEGILRSLESLGVAPGDALYVGDSLSDAEAAAAAGVRSVGAGWAPHSVAVTSPATFDITCSTPMDVARVDP